MSDVLVSEAAIGHPDMCSAYKRHAACCWDLQPYGGVSCVFVSVFRIVLETFS